MSINDRNHTTVLCATSLSDVSISQFNVEERLNPPTPAPSAELTDSWDTRSLAPSSHAAANRLRIVLRSEAQVYEEELKIAHEFHQLRLETAEATDDKTKEDQKAIKRPGGWYRRETWPTFRRTVSSIRRFRNKEHSATATPSVYSTLSTALEPQIQLRTSTDYTPPQRSPSIFSSLSLRRRKLSEIGRSSPATSTRGSSSRLLRPTLPFRARSLSDTTPSSTTIRRSRSFSDFDRMLAVIADEAEELDEVTLEASQVAIGVRRRWLFEDPLPDFEQSPLTSGFDEDD